MKTKPLLFLFILNSIISFSQSRKTNYINDLIIYDKLSIENLITYNEKYENNVFIKYNTKILFDTIRSNAEFININKLDSLSHLILIHNIQKSYQNIKNYKLDKNIVKKQDSLKNNRPELFMEDCIDCFEIENEGQSKYKKFIYNNDGTVKTIIIYNEEGIKTEKKGFIYDNRKRIISQSVINCEDNDCINSSSYYYTIGYNYDRDIDNLKLIFLFGSKENIYSYDLLNKRLNYNNNGQITNIQSLNQYGYHIENNKSISDSSHNFNVMFNNKKGNYIFSIDPIQDNFEYIENDEALQIINKKSKIVYLSVKNINYDILIKNINLELNTIFKKQWQD